MPTAISSASGDQNVKLPSASRQSIFFLTGVLAGAASLPVEGTFLSLTGKPFYRTGLQHIKSHAPAVLGRTGIRFLTFDHIRTYSSQFLHLPTTLCGALGGAAGGLNEVLLHSLASTRRLPPLKAAVSQSGKLFLCFGSYTYLSTTLNPEQLPPKPFWKCWLMGVTAGCVGSGITAALEGARRRALLMAAVRGTLVVGTVIAVQVSSCGAVLGGLRL